MFQIDKSVNLMLKMLKMQYREFSNAILSPFSLEILSFSILAGTNGHCWEELSNCLFGKNVSLDEVGEAIRCFKQIIGHINSLQSVDFKMNNFIYVSDKFKIQQSYSDFVFHYLNTRLRQINFDDESLEVYNTIDADIRNATCGRIQKVLKCLPTVSRLMMVNCISFQGELKFKPIAQYDGKFQATNQEEATARFTVQKNNFKFIEKQEFVYVELPYKNETMNLCIVFPNVEVSVRDVMNQLSYPAISELFASSVQTSCEVHLPNVKLQWNVDLAMVLQLSGISKVFDEEQADFSKLAITPKGLYLESVITNSELNLQDLSKTSTTNIQQVEGIPEPNVKPAVILNRPFIYFVNCNMKKQMQAILFAGVVNVIES